MFVQGLVATIMLVVSLLPGCEAETSAISLISIETRQIKLVQPIELYGDLKTAFLNIAPIEATTVLTDGTKLSAGMVIETHHYFPVSDRPGWVGEYVTDYTPGTITLISQDSGNPDYWKVLLEAGTDKLEAYLYEPVIYEAALGHRVTRDTTQLYIKLKPNNRVNVRQEASTTASVLAQIANASLEYKVISQASTPARLWYQIQNSVANSWTTGWVAADFFETFRKGQNQPFTVIRINLDKTKGQPVRVRAAAGTAADIVGRISDPNLRYETFGGVLLGDKMWYKIRNDRHLPGHRDESWSVGYVLADFFIKEVR